MKTAVIVYRSRNGTTRRLAEEIGAFLATRDIEPRVVTADTDPHADAVDEASAVQRSRRNCQVRRQR